MRCGSVIVLVNTVVARLNRALGTDECLRNSRKTMPSVDGNTPTDGIYFDLGKIMVTLAALLT